jgi:putative lysine transport system permease protein
MPAFLASCGTVLQKYGMSYLRGAGTTLLIALVGTFFGCLIGFAVGVLQTIPIDKKRDPAGKRFLLHLLRAVLRCYVELFRGTPMIVQAVFIYYGAMQVFNLKMGMWTAAFFIVSINTGAYMAETVRGGIISVDPGQTEGARAIGMTHFQTMNNVILPQALRSIIPQIGNNFIINIKDTSVLSVIAITDLFFVHKSVVGALYRYFESACIVMVIYLTMTMAASWLLRLWEKKLDGPENYDLATTDTLAYTSGTYNFPPKADANQNLDVREGL